MAAECLAHAARARVPELRRVVHGAGREEVARRVEGDAPGSLRGGVGGEMNGKWGQPIRPSTPAFGRACVWSVSVAAQDAEASDQSFTTPSPADVAMCVPAGWKSTSASHALQQQGRGQVWIGGRISRFP